MDDIVSYRLSIPNHSFDDGMPLGPWPTELEAISSLKNWATNPNYGGGSFGIITLSSDSKGNGRHGQTRLLACDKAGRSDDKEEVRKRKTVSKKVNCPWSLYLEKVDIGWVARNMRPSACTSAGSHGGTHTLAVTLAERNANPSLRAIPSTLLETAHTLRSADNSISQIYTFLSHLWRSRGNEVTFIYNDIKNEFRGCYEERILDSTDLVLHLQERMEQDDSLGFAMKLDECAKLDCLFFVMKGGHALWKENACRLVLYDTKHGTNRFGLKLGLFTCVDVNGKTRVLAGSFVMHEDKESFTWAMSQFNKHFVEKPAVAFTDSDRAIAAAIKAAWPTTNHFLCTFHLYKNFYEHMHGLFTNRKAAWTKARSLFWKLCKEPDVQSKSSFEQEWEALVTHITESASASADKVRPIWCSIGKLIQSALWYSINPSCYRWCHRCLHLQMFNPVEQVRNRHISLACKVCFENGLDAEKRLAGCLGTV